jgi:hypothetical protein
MIFFECVLEEKKICDKIILLEEGASLWLLGEESPKGNILFLKGIFCIICIIT